MRIIGKAKKWLRMLTGKSNLHVKQEAGKYYSKHEIKGYYNDLTQKVFASKDMLDEEGIVYCIDAYNRKVYFPIAIFQYGLGCYDLYLGDNDKEYLVKFLKAADWALKNQNEQGAGNFSIEKNHFEPSSMAQGEGASLLVRAYKETGDEIYIKAAKKALEMMLQPLEQFGTA